MTHNSAVAYRPDIDGLRAIAVLAVVFYHFGIGGISGGFVGVDVFFVISGFLITGIIHREIEQGKFTFTGFYERRIRRIFPALFVVLATSLVVGSWLLLPSDLVLLGKSTLATLFFSSNIYFWRNSGYFDSSSELNPLLHTWSLAVEEQFYIGLPIMLLLFYRYARGRLKHFIVAAAVLSFSACLWQQSARPTATFYLLPFRAWELLVGSYLAVGSLPSITKLWLRECLAWIGLVMLLTGILLIEAGPEFPGWKALVPVMGTGILIYSGSSGQSSVAYLLSMKPIVFIGLISYSLYLWHWPILVYIKFQSNLDMSIPQAVLGLILSLLMSIATYYYVETPFRAKREIYTRKKLFIGSAISGAALIFFSLSVLIGKGFAGRVSQEVMAMDALGNELLSNQPRCHRKFDLQTHSLNCRLGDQSIPPSAVLWGDSHALAISSAFDIALDSMGKSSYLISYDSCPPIFEIERVGEYRDVCLKQNREFLKWLIQNTQIKTVILHSYWNNKSYYIQDEFQTKQLIDGDVLRDMLLNTVQKLQAMGRNVIIIGPIPNSPVFPKQLALIQWHGDKLPSPASYSQFKIDTASYNNAVSIYSNFRGIEMINPSDRLCNLEDCLYINNGKMLYKDGNHINAYGTEFLSPMLTAELSKVLSK